MRASVLLLTLFLFTKVYSQDKKPEPVLIGEQHYFDLFDNKLFPWFKTGVVQYNYNPQVVVMLKPYAAGGIHFVVFGGSWCEDTQQLLPRFYKVVLDAGFNERDIYLYMLDRNKTCPTKNEDGLNITHLPTFIVYRNGQEIGRIVESVQQSIEADLLEILKN